MFLEIPTRSPCRTVGVAWEVGRPEKLPAPHKHLSPAAIDRFAVGSSCVACTRAGDSRRHGSEWTDPNLRGRGGLRDSAHGAGREAGRQVKPEVPGADYVDRSMVSADEFTAEMQTYLQDDYWVAVWCVRVWTVG